MIHDPDLLDRLAACVPMRFDGEVFRATRSGLDPLTASSAGGRWMLPGQFPTLHTSCEREGAMAEIAYHWSQLDPMPSKPAMLHRLAVRVGRTLRLGRTELLDLGVEWSTYAADNPQRTQAIGAAAAYLDYDGLIVPSARWACDNVVLFLANHNEQRTLVLVATEVADWREGLKRQDSER